MSINDDHNWVTHAACANDEPDSLFVQGAAQRQVRQKCFGCPVRLECLADALDSQANFGVWGGLTERERRALLKHYPDITDWKQWLWTSQCELAQELRAPHVPHVFSHMRAVPVAC